MKRSEAFACKGRRLIPVLAVAVLIMRLGAGQPAQTDPVIREGDTKEFPRLSAYGWPTAEQMKSALVPEAASTPAGLQALDWIRKVIRPTALPDDLAGGFVGMRHYVHGYDAGLVRYKSGPFLAQLVVTSGHIILLVRDTTPTSRASKDDMVRFVHAVINRFFNESEALLKTELTLVEKGRTLKGVNARISHVETMLNLRSWTETVQWWTNGELVCFWLTLHPGASEGDRKDWFSYTYSKKPQRQPTQR
jgi:hypothetical protein